MPNLPSVLEDPWDLSLHEGLVNPVEKKNKKMLTVNERVLYVIPTFTQSKTSHARTDLNEFYFTLKCIEKYHLGTIYTVI